MDRIDTRLSQILSRGWWQLLLRGIAAILFGILTWTRPAISLAALILLFGAYAIIDGTLISWTAVSGRGKDNHWGMMLLAGIISVAAGIIAFVNPGFTALTLLIWIAIWAIARGILEVVVAVRLRREIEGEWLLTLAGAASVLFGILLLTRPAAGVLAVLWLIAAYAVTIGVLLVALAVKARKLATTPAYASRVI